MKEQQIPKGYKHTEVGAFSEDWEVKRLGDLLTYERPDRYIVHNTEYGTHGLMPVLTANKSFILGYTSEDFGICDDTPVIVFDDFTTESKYVDFPFKVKSSAIKLLRPRIKQVSLRYIFERIQLIRFPIGDHKRYYISEYQNLRLPIPDFDEQKAIIRVLSDMDAEIEALERRREKTRQVKQGMMQQLLTGKTRLPGFSEDWEVKRLGDLLTYERPDRYIVHNTEYGTHGLMPVLTANKSFILGYTSEDFGICDDTPVIVFDDFTTESKYVDFPFKVKSSAIKLLRPRIKQVSLRYIFERIQLIRFPIGDHKRYYISEYQNLRLPIPDFDEQKAIIRVLSDMDAEIEALERRREKTRQVKQGMMQQLLTGRVRLVKPETRRKESQ